MRGDEASTQITTAQRRIALSAMTLGLLVAALDQMILSTAAAAISADLGGLSRLPWLFSAYLVSSACTMPLWGRLGDVYGRRRVFRVGIGIFVSASLLAGTSRSMELLVVARVLQGIGAGGLLTLPNAIVADLVEPRLRASYYALNTAVWAAAGLLGPLVGGLIVDHLGWRYIFFIHVPVGLLAILLMAAGPRTPQARASHALDYSGAGLLAISVGALILLCGGLGLGQSHTLSALLLAAACGFGWLFVRHERRVADPLVPLSLVAVPTVRLGITVSGLYGFANFAIAIFIPLFAITVAGTNATEAGLRLLPVPIGLMLGSFFVGRRIARGASSRLYPAIGLCIQGLALSVFASFQGDTPRVVVLLVSLVAGLGAGGVNPVITYALQHSVPNAQVGLVTALPTFTRFVAQAVGIAALGALMTLRLDVHLAAAIPDLPPDLQPDTLQARAEDIRALGEPLASQVALAFRRALSEMFLVMVGIMAIAMLVSLRIPRVDATSSRAGA